MKRSIFINSLVITIFLFGCDNDEVNIQLNPETDLSFTGTFNAKNSENVSGIVTLQISDGY